MSNKIWSILTDVLKESGYSQEDQTFAEVRSKLDARLQEWAAKNGKSEVDMNTRDEDGRTALHCAVSEKDVTVRRGM